MTAAARPPRLFALMVVRDAADLLAINVRHHLAQGVERFLVLDHQSADETPAVLERFTRLGCLEWERVEGPFCCERWTNELAHAAFLQGADWVLPIDADELWVAAEGRLLDVLARTDAAALAVRRVNFVQQHEQRESAPEGLLRMTCRVAQPVPLPGSRTRIEDGSLPFLAGEPPPKWIGRATPALWIRRGDHQVSGLGGRREARPDLACLHAPLRSRAALARRRTPEALADPALAPGDSWHWRRWAGLGDGPALDAEWAANSARDGRLVASGMRLVEDTRLRDAVNRALADDAAGDPADALDPTPPDGPSRPASSLGRARQATQHWRSALAQRDEEVAASTSSLARLSEEVERRGVALAAAADAAARLREEGARRDAAVGPRLEVLAQIESSRAFRWWMASIRARQALRRRRPERPSIPAAPGSHATDLRRQVGERGYFAPLRVLAPEECRRVLAALRATPPTGRDWSKDQAVGSRLLYDLATLPAILRVVTAVLGDDVVLWGAILLARGPGAVHPWHTDIESSSPTGGMVSVWVGLENTSRQSSLAVVPGSHRFGAPLQKVAAAQGRRRGESSTEDVARWARERGAPEGVVQLDTGDGEAIVFDGRLWHGSRNESETTRTALLLQYAAARTPVRIPDFAVLEYPFRLLDEPRPACLLVAGSPPSPAVNRLVPPPPVAPSELSALPALCSPITLPLATDERTGWKPYHLFRGTTPNVAALGCHVSVLAPGRSPHPPHEHAEEELLIVLAGAAELVLVDAAGVERAYLVGPGCLGYYPAHQLHTLRTPEREPATYLMFKWVGRTVTGGAALPAAVHDFAERLAGTEPGGGFAARTLFEGPTRQLGRLHTHCSAVAPGGGYEPHVDDHDVALVVFEGTVEAAGLRAGPHDVVFFPAGVPHGLRNPGTETARYLVVEFHQHEPGAH